MDTHTLGNSRIPRSLALLTGVCLLAALALAAAIAAYGHSQGVDSYTLPVAGRTLNQFMAVVLTCIALIVPLTANLYTPKLVTLYVKHPLIVSMLSLLLVSHTISLALNFIPPQRALAHVLVKTLALIYLLVMAGALPYLYSISQFLRPSFFMPMLTRKGIRSMQDLIRGRRPRQNAHDLFETIDVVTNTALTGMARGDRQLVLLSLQSLNILLTELIGSQAQGSQRWRDHNPSFVPGLAQEGQDYLAQQRLWPEAYVLAQMLKVVEGAGRRDHELLAELAGHLVDTARLAEVLGRDPVVELHVMAFNALMRQAVEDKDLRRFQNLSYHYRLLIEAFQDSPERMHSAAGHLLHYARMSVRNGLAFGLETVIYDVGELVLSVARMDEGRAQEIVQAWAGPLLQDSLEQPGLRKVAWRTLLRIHWEAKAAGLDQVAQAIYWRFLTDEPIHREQLEMVLDENRTLHFEFNDRLMRFAHFSPEAVEEAQGFLGSW